ncbi:unnamed protein product [Closterium sp. NIES-65]|nr:unnamed protein product [Closterium sp. NIES-65]
MFPPAFAGPVRRVARTRQAHDEFLRQRQLSGDERQKLIHVADRRDSQAPLHILKTKSSFYKCREKRRNQAGLMADTILPIAYNGGPVMNGSTINAYLIYYGTWPAKSGQNIIENFIPSLSLSSADSQGVTGDPKVGLW